MRAIFAALKEQGMDIVVFLDLLTWGDDSCISNHKCRYERAALFNSAEFPGMLRRWWRVPGGRAETPRAMLQEFVVEHAGELIEQEMKGPVLASLLAAPPEEDPLSLTVLTSLKFASLAENIRTTGAPVLWQILQGAAWTKRQALVNTHKTPQNVLMNIIAMLAYSRSSHCNRLAVLWSIYLKSCGLSARAFDTVHAIGLTMSHKWTSEGWKKIATTQMENTRANAETRAWFMSYDNLNIPRRVFSQRLDNKDMFYSACAATLWVLPKGVKMPDSAAYQRASRAGAKQPFDSRKLILEGDPAAKARVRAQAVYRILRFLVDSPVFATYEDRADIDAEKPAPVHQLPHGPEHIVQQFILRTADIDESSYEGNEKAIEEWMRQLGFDSREQRKKTSTDRLIVMVGDQLTAERLRGMMKYRSDDMNGYERLDWVRPQFGWFHLQMAFAVSLHKQYLGTAGGIGLQRAFHLLQRKGLTNTQTKGPFWHHLNEALKHFAEACIHACWLTIAGVEKLEDLLQQPPEALVIIAEDIYDQLASRKGLMKRVLLRQKQKDPVIYQMTMFNMDVLYYLDLCDAMPIGEVGRMDDLIPTLTQRFAGGGHPKYLIEMLEHLQCFHQEWPPDLKDFVRKYCWLVNRSGKPDGFTAVDQAQEQNIKDLKVTYRASGPGATLEHLAKVSPAVPVLRAVKDCIKWQIQLVKARGTKHTVPAKEKDVELLKSTAMSEGWFTYTDGRTIKRPEDVAKDVLSLGTQALFEDGAIERWWSGRAFERRATERWADEPGRADGRGVPAPVSTAAGGIPETAQVEIEVETDITEVEVSEAPVYIE
ncbi:hypothetical protein FA95DRAFT_1663095 [Auriscalpium vulgare]|uniref:Uncharacterized protein n=1 Tax=Auriscalpium vulgare TaxID=40419 RepID=A0ACB8RUJ3_9AGAM|nr:hypothetical protein FA95DRAFT_1663095 [Auriscalpium vulgare]